MAGNTQLTTNYASGSSNHLVVTSTHIRTQYVCHTY